MGLWRLRGDKAVLVLSSELSIHPGKLKQVHKEPENSWWQVAGARGREKQSLCTRKVGVRVRSPLSELLVRKGTHVGLGTSCNAAPLSLRSRLGDGSALPLPPPRRVEEAGTVRNITQGVHR